LLNAINTFERTLLTVGRFASFVSIQTCSNDARSSFAMS